MNFRKIVNLLMVLMLVVVVFAGCSSKKTESEASATPIAATANPAETKTADAAKPDISKEVKLKMIMLGDAPPDTQLVYDEVNKKLKKDINATVELEWIAWGDLGTKYPLALASGQDFDIIQTANWNGYSTNARNGAFKEITKEDLAKYAPQTLANDKQEVFDSAMVDGKLYALPMNYHETTIYGYVVRGDLMEKYNITDIKSIDDLGKYLDAVKNNEKDITPWDGKSSPGLLYDEILRMDNLYNLNFGDMVVKIDDPKPKVGLIYDSPDMIKYLKLMQEWGKKGYWTKGSIVSKTDGMELFNNGAIAASITNIYVADNTYQALKVTHPDWDVRFYPTNPDKTYLANPFINNGEAINAKSKNYERALMMLDLFKNDVEYNHLTSYGIKGKHYDLTPDNRLINLPDSKNFPPLGAFPYGWREDRYELIPAKGLPNFEAVLKNVSEHIGKTNIRNFTPDNTNYKGNEAALKDVVKQYMEPMYFGIIKNTVEQDLQTVKEKMKAAGLDKVLEDVQKQLDAYKVELN